MRLFTHFVTVLCSVVTLLLVTVIVVTFIQPASLGPWIRANLWVCSIWWGCAFMPVWIGTALVMKYLDKRRARRGAPSSADESPRPEVPEAKYSLPIVLAVFVLGMMISFSGSTASVRRADEGWELAGKFQKWGPTEEQTATYVLWKKLRTVAGFVLIQPVCMIVVARLWAKHAVG